MKIKGAMQEVSTCLHIDLLRLLTCQKYMYLEKNTSDMLVILQYIDKGQSTLWPVGDSWLFKLSFQSDRSFRRVLHHINLQCAAKWCINSDFQRSNEWQFMKVKTKFCYKHINEEPISTNTLIKFAKHSFNCIGHPKKNTLLSWINVKYNYTPANEV